MRCLRLLRKSGGTLYRKVGRAPRVDTGQQWAEVNFVPNWIGHSKNSPEYRFIAIQGAVDRNPPLPGMEEPDGASVPRDGDWGNRGWYKVFGVVTNRELDWGRVDPVVQAEMR